MKLKLFIAAALLLAIVGNLSAVDLTYQGAFRVPKTGNSRENLVLEYGGAAIAFNPANDSLFITGQDQAERIAEITIPAPRIGSVDELERGEFLQLVQNLRVRSAGNIGGNVKIGGLMVYGGDLYVSRFEFYDAEGDARHSHCRIPGGDLARTAEGMYELNSPGGGWVGGYMGEIPASLRPKFGNKPCFTGLGVISIISRASSGPAAFAFDPAQLGSSRTPTVPIVGYPLKRPLANPELENDYFTRADQIRGAVMFEDSMLFFGIHGMGRPTYGDGGEQDPADSNKGEHAYPYRAQCWEYAVSDLIPIAADKKPMWDARPTVRELKEFYGSNRYGGGAAYDAKTGRLFLSNLRGEEAYPVIHVYQVAASQATTASAAAEKPMPADLQTQVESLTAEVARLQAEVEALKEKLAQIHAASKP
jgi:hypothetical protein